MEQLNVSDYSTAAGAAKAVGSHLKDIAESIGQKPSEVTVKKREDDSLGERWVVIWDGGPFEWAIKLTGGEALFGVEPEVTGFYDMDGVDAQCENRMTISFYNQ